MGKPVLRRYGNFALIQTYYTSKKSGRDMLQAFRYSILLFLLPLSVCFAQDPQTDPIVQNEQYTQAMSGDPEAEYQVASKYLNRYAKKEGESPEEDLKNAFLWMKKSAENGYAGAMWRLSGFYEDGKGTKKNMERALHWSEQWMKATLKKASGGDKLAQSQLGKTYAEGWLGVDKDPLKAIYWYEKSGAQGDAKSLRLLGDYYAQGTDVSLDLEKARQYYASAAEKGDSMGRHNVRAMDTQIKMQKAWKRGYQSPLIVAASRDANAPNVEIYYSPYCVTCTKALTESLPWFRSKVESAELVALFANIFWYDDDFPKLKTSRLLECISEEVDNKAFFDALQSYSQFVSDQYKNDASATLQPAVASQAYSQLRSQYSQVSDACINKEIPAAKKKRMSMAAKKLNLAEMPAYRFKKRVWNQSSFPELKKLIDKPLSPKGSVAK